MSNHNYKKGVPSGGSLKIPMIPKCYVHSCLKLSRTARMAGMFIATVCGQLKLRPIKKTVIAGWRRGKTSLSLLVARGKELSTSL